MSLVLLRRPAVLAARGRGNTSLFLDIKRGVWTEPVKIGRSTLWPKHEVEALLAAEIAGKSDNEMRTLAHQLMEARKSMPTRYAGAA